MLLQKSDMDFHVRFTTKYYPRKAECVDVVVNHQTYDLTYKKGMADTLATQFISAARK